VRARHTRERKAERLRTRAKRVCASGAGEREVTPLAVAATAPFGADVLERLAAEQDVVQLLTRPDKPRGRGRRVAPPPAKEVAERLGIPVAQPSRLDASVELAADTVVVCAYGLLIPSVLLERALWLNVHPSLLPRWRGAAPVERALMAGDGQTGVTIHRTIEALDAGPIAAQRAFAIAPEDDAGAVYARAAEVSSALLRDVLAAAEPRFEPQPEEGVTYAEKIGPEDRELDPDAPPEQLVNRVRALSPHIGARLGGLIVWRARVGEDGSFEPLEVQPAGGRRMAYDAYLRGRR
jgi:methionyl-tRNA formyltransferase